MRGRGVRAFIDSNRELQGGDYKNVPVISFETYLERYQDCVVIVTPLVGAGEVEQLLCQRSIAYLSVEILPQEITCDGISKELLIKSPIKGVCSRNWR